MLKKHRVALAKSHKFELMWDVVLGEGQQTDSTG